MGSRFPPAALVPIAAAAVAAALVLLPRARWFEQLALQAARRSAAAGREGARSLARPGRRWLRERLEDAGHPDGMPRLVTAMIVVSVGAGVCGCLGGWLLSPPSAAILAAAGAVIGPLAVAAALAGRSRERRRLIASEVPAVLELMTLELSSGVSPQTAFASVLSRVDCALALELNRLVIATQLSAGSSLDQALAAFADRREIPSLSALAGILAAGRDYGAGVQEAVRALAAEQRRAQRRDVIAAGRRCLNRVLIPAAVGVLLPFLAVLLFPAVATLAGALR